MLSVTGKNILVTLTSNEEELENGLSIESKITNRRKIVSGTVDIIGSDCKYTKKNDTVYFPMYAADEFTYKGTLKYILSEEDVKVIEEEQSER